MPISYINPRGMKAFHERKKETVVATAAIISSANDKPQRLSAAARTAMRTGNVPRKLTGAAKGPRVTTCVLPT